MGKIKGGHFFVDTVYFVLLNQWASTHQNVSLRCKLHLVSLWPWPLTFDLENFFSNVDDDDHSCAAKFHWSAFTKTVVTSEIKQKQNTETILKRFRIVLELFQAHYHISWHVEKYANPKTVSLFQPITTHATDDDVINDVVQYHYCEYGEQGLQISHAYFCFVSAFCFTCKHAETKLKQNNFTETKHCFAFALFQFYFSFISDVTTALHEETM